MQMLAKIKNMWAVNPVLVLVFVAFSLAMLSLFWAKVSSAFSYVRDNVRGVGSSLSKDEAQAIASSIYEEVNSMFTNEGNIVDVVVPLSLSDYFKVKAEFGIHSYDATLDEFNFWGKDRNLTEILNLTLSDNDKEKIKAQNPFLPIG